MNPVQPIEDEGIRNRTSGYPDAGGCGKATGRSECIGLAGLGSWGKNILRELHHAGRLHVACDTDPAILDERRRQFPDVVFTSSFDELLSDGGISAVVIASPASMHHACAKKALEAGKDVFVEKPLSLKVREGEELVRLAEDKGLVLMVGHLLHYHPAVVRLKELIRSGVLGQIRYISSHRLNIGTVRTGENVLWSFAPHDISVMLALAGSEPHQVNASGGCYLSPGVCDTAVMTMEFGGGVRGHIFVNWLHPFKEQKLVVVGSDAMAVFDDQSSEKLVVYRHGIEWREGRVPVAKKASGQVMELEDRSPLREELDHFVECVGSRKRPRTDGHEGLRVLRVLERADSALPHGCPAEGAAGQGELHTPVAPSARIHETAWIDDNVRIGENAAVWHFSHLLGGTSIGRGVIIGQNVTVGPDVTVGDGCKIQNNVSVYRGVTLEEEVFCGPSCVFTNVYNPRAFIERKREFLKTLVRKGATIGANATVVCGTTIGRYAMIGAGAVVKADVPDYAVVAGVPAARIGWACRCGVTLKMGADGEATCRSCGDRYRLAGGLLQPVEEQS